MDDMNAFKDREGCLNRLSPVSKMRPIILSMLLAVHIPSHAKEKMHYGLCAASETTLFDCELNNRNASLCFNEKKKSIYYRIETGAKKDFIYPKRPERDEYDFKLSTTPYPGGGENRISFKNSIYRYFLYDVTKTERGTSSFNSIQTAGIIVYANDKKIANLKCENSETSIAPLAFKILQREEFSYDINTD